MRIDPRLRTADPFQITLTRPAAGGTEVYRLALVGRPAGHFVNYGHGLDGSKLKIQTATPSALTLADAEETYSGLVRKWIAEGYSAVGARAERINLKKAPARATNVAAKDRFVIWSTGGKKVDRGVLSGKIGFTQKQQVWFVGLEIASKKHGEDKVQMIVHLREFPVHGIDVRNEPFRIRLDRGSNFATALGRGWLTNLYYYEHTETEDNDIVVAPLARNRYRVKWSAAGESMSDHFAIDCVAALTRKLRYP